MSLGRFSWEKNTACFRLSVRRSKQNYHATRAVFDKSSPAGTTEGISYRPDPSDFPIPELIFIALRLLGFALFGPEEKCRWTVEFSYLGRPAAVSFKKFGFTITIDRTLTSSETKRLEGHLRQAAQTIEKWLEPQAEAEILEGNFLIASRR